MTGNVYYKCQDCNYQTEYYSKTIKHAIETHHSVKRKIRPPTIKTQI